MKGIVDLNLRELINWQEQRREIALYQQQMN